jgi:DNA-binding response OmpR family regulator
MRRIRELNPAVRVVLITGHPVETAQVAEQLNTLGVDAVHYKPFDIPRLLADVERLAREARERATALNGPRKSE